MVSPGDGATRSAAPPPERLVEPKGADAGLERGLLRLLAVSLIAHLCLLVAFALLSPQRLEAERARETPVEVVVEQPRAAPQPADKAASPPESPKPSPAANEKPPESKPPEPKPPASKPSESSQPESRQPEAKPPAQKPPPDVKPKETKPAQSSSGGQKAFEKPAAKRAEVKPPLSQPAPSGAGPRASAAAPAKPASAAHAAVQTGDFGPRSGPWGGLRLPFDNGPPLFRAVAVPVPTEGGDEPMSFKMIVFGLLERAKHFPDSARERGARGSAVVTFTLDDAGELTNVSLLRSSGDADLDAESLALVARAAPFPKPPPDAQHAFAAEITFGLERRE